MEQFNPLSREKLNNLFKTSSINPNRLIKREDSSIEFKESYNHGSMASYFKTMASFANRSGGYIIFGVGNKPRDLIGLTSKSLKQFEEIKIEEFTRNLCDYFSPEIQWVNATYDLFNKLFGIIYIYELENKPAICRKSYDSKDDKYSLKEGDIYYRYSGRSERIRYPELNYIIETQRRNEQKQWMKFIARASKIGIENAAILDISSGKIEGKTGSLLIDESLLSQIAFIKEGHFNETLGMPTLKLIGNVEPIKITDKIILKRELVKIKGINEADVIESFLLNHKVEEPKEYILQICNLNTAYVPVYFYMNLADISINETIDLIETVNVRNQSKSKLLERINLNKREYKVMKSERLDSMKAKKSFMKMFFDENIPEQFKDNELLYCVQSIRYMTDDEIKSHFDYIKNKILLLYRKHYSSARQTLADSFRRTFCRMDEALYAPK